MKRREFSTHGASFYVTKCADEPRPRRFIGQHEAVAVEQASRLVDLCMKSFQRAAR